MARLLLAALALLAIGCVAAGDEPARTSPRELPAPQWWLRPAAPLGGEPCAGAEPLEPIGGALRLRIHVGEEVPFAAAESLVQGLARLLEPYGVALVSPDPVRRVALTTLLPGRLDEVRAAIALDDPEVSERAVAAQVFAPLRRFVTTYSRPRVQGVVNLVVVQEVAPPGTLAAGVLGEVGGLGVSSELIAGTPLHQIGSWQAAGLVEDFTPTVFLSWRFLAPRGDVARAMVVGHELGHALGWQHAVGPGDLMTAGEPGPCVPGLTASQRAALRLASRSAPVAH